MEIKEGVYIDKSIIDNMIRIDSFDIALDFNKASKPLFDLMREYDINEVTFYFEVAFQGLIKDSFDMFKYALEDYLDKAIFESEEIYNYQDLENLVMEVRKCINIQKDYKSIVLKKFEEEDYKITYKILGLLDSYSSYHTYWLSKDNIISRLRKLNGRLDELKPKINKKEEKLDYCGLIIIMKLNHIKSITGCYNFEDLSKKKYIREKPTLFGGKYTISKKECRKLHLKVDLLAEYLDCLLEVANDSDCPNEIIAKYYKVLDVLYTKKTGSRTATDIVNDAIVSYRDYKKSGCYIEEVKEVK